MARVVVEEDYTYSIGSDRCHPEGLTIMDYIC